MASPNRLRARPSRCGARPHPDPLARAAIIAASAWTAREREHDRDDPEADHDLRLGPAHLLEVMVDRRHPEHALAGELERDHLHDHRHRFEHEQPADDRQHDLVLGGDRDRAEHAAERERAGVAHEDRRRRRVEPEEAEAGADHRAAQHRELAGAGDVVDLQIVGEARVAGEIGDDAEAQRRDHHRHDGEPVEAVGEVHRVAGADDDEGAEHEEEPAERQHQLLEERKRERRRERLAPERHDEVARDRRDQRPR